MKNILLFVIAAFSSLGIFQVDAINGCKNKIMNDICLTNSIDRCYSCINNEVITDNTVCVPVFQNTLGTLENYPTDKWNCTMYRPDVENRQEIIKDICEIDQIIVGLCNDENIDGLCEVAAYINTLCHHDEKEHKDDKDDVEDINKEDDDLGLGYSSPWGKKSQCMTDFYKKTCSNDAVKYCYDCRTPNLSVETIKSYYYHCHTLSKSENEEKILKWLDDQHYECALISNNNYEVKDDVIKQVSLAGNLLYPACDGPICEKKEWSYQDTVYGKNWCGNGVCKTYGNRKVYCDQQSICGIKRSSPSMDLFSYTHNTEDEYDEMDNNEDMLNDKFHVMACGKEKLKCMLSKGCRHLLKEIENCNEDYACIYPIVSTSGNESFNKLANCMFGK